MDGLEQFVNLSEAGIDQWEGATTGAGQVIAELETQAVKNGGVQRELSKNAKTRLSYFRKTYGASST